MAKSDWSLAATHFLSEIYSQNQQSLLTTQVGQDSIQSFTRAIFHLFQSQIDHERCFEWIKEGLDWIGDIRNLFSIEYSGLFRNTIADYKCKIPSLVENGKFKSNAIAKLHYLKAEVMGKLRVNPRAIAEEYELAAKLAPGNPFGFRALFMKDEEPYSENDGTAYKNCAAKWIK